MQMKLLNSGVQVSFGAICGRDWAHWALVRHWFLSGWWTSAHDGRRRRGGNDRQFPAPPGPGCNPELINQADRSRQRHSVGCVVSLLAFFIFVSSFSLVRVNWQTQLQAHTTIPSNHHHIAHHALHPHRQENRRQARPSLVPVRPPPSPSIPKPPLTPLPASNSTPSPNQPQAPANSSSKSPPLPSTTATSSSANTSTPPSPSPPLSSRTPRASSSPSAGPPLPPSPNPSSTAPCSSPRPAGGRRTP